MRIIVYSTKSFDKTYLENANQGQHALSFVPDMLTFKTAEKANGYDGICCFVSDHINGPLMAKLAENGIKLIALRSAGYDHVDMVAAKKHNIAVVLVPKYSPQAIAEFATGLILALNRHIHKAYQEGLQYNFSLEGLMGFNLYEKTVGIIGTGNIGSAFARIMSGFGCHVIAYDPVPNETCKQLGVKYVELNQLYGDADIISLHCPHNDQTRNMINAEAFALMKKGAMLINTGRGPLVDTQALIQALESGKLGYAGLDVYAKESALGCQLKVHAPY
jgi:D-lactate dehydrogenase